ncbi:hypothetical protein [Mycobacterium tuberculosis]|uniref:hypothetical protein n=1 Tax=Mycobacterium tuberculosis TaxID=1773 RepID=UPI00272B92E8|nr:hypothetical protein [Mycobacterium tuberculosis]
MINATIASIEKVDRDGIVVKLAEAELSNEKRIEVHEGERIRWTDSDKRDGRGMINATIASIEKVDRDGIVVKLADPRGIA